MNATATAPATIATADAPAALIPGDRIAVTLADGTRGWGRVIDAPRTVRRLGGRGDDTLISFRKNDGTVYNWFAGDIASIIRF